MSTYIFIEETATPFKIEIRTLTFFVCEGFIYAGSLVLFSLLLELILAE